MSLLTWNPLEKDCKDLEKMDWFETVMRYGFKSNETVAKLLDDPDIRFVPTLIEKIVLPKITGTYYRNCCVILIQLKRFFTIFCFKNFFRTHRKGMGSIVF